MIEDPATKIQCIELRVCSVSSVLVGLDVCFCDWPVCEKQGEIVFVLSY